MFRLISLILMLLGVISSPALAAGVSLQIVIDLEGEAQRNITQYKCDEATDLVEVEYINSNPNFLAVMSVDGDKRLFANTFSTTGARYVSGRYVWWTKGGDAELFDEANGADAEPLVTCIEVSNTP